MTATTPTTGVASRVRLRPLPAVYLALTVVVELVSVVISWGLEAKWDTLLYAVNTIIMVGVGALIASRHPENLVGWLFCWFGLLEAVMADLAQAWALRGAEEGWPGVVPAEAVSLISWLPSGLGWTLTFLLFPDGRLPGPRWRIVPWIAFAGWAISVPAWLLDPGQGTNFRSGENPLAVHSDLPVLLLIVGMALFLAALVLSALSLVVRYRRSRGLERQQLKWIAVAAAYAGIGLPLAVLLWDVWTPIRVITALILTALPLAVGAAILRYRLYDIDVVISRSLVFGALATFITAVYVAIVVGLGHLIGRGDQPNLALSVAATAIVAVAFEPVRDRLQRFANRLVYGERATPYEVLSDFADRMGGAYDATQLLPLMARTVGRGVEAAQVEVWLRHDRGFDLAATWTSDDRTVPGRRRVGGLGDITGDRVVPVSDRGELLGAVALVKPAAKELTPVEEGLLETLAAQAGPVLRNVRLIEDLRSSRQRLVATQDDERRRLERNLHDGAQQSLVAVALMLRLVQPKVAAQDQPAAASLERAAAELGRAVEDLRELARGIYPVVLTERGIGAALSSLAERLPVPVVVDDQVKDRLEPEIERALYFIAFEALTSSSRGGAAEAAVGLQQSDGDLILRVSDDGCAPEDPRRALALQNLLDRAAVVDATLEVTDDPGAGMHLRCTVPLPTVSPSVSSDAALTAVPLGAGQ